MAAHLNQFKLTEIIHQYAKVVGSLINLDAIYLFGSYVKGTADKDSDIDLLVVSPDWTDDIINDTMLLMRARRSIDLRIEPHPIRPEELDENPFVLSIKAEMKKVN